LWLRLPAAVEEAARIGAGEDADQTARLVAGQNGQQLALKQGQLLRHPPARDAVWRVAGMTVRVQTTGQGPPDGTGVQALKDWSSKRPELFDKRVRTLPGPDTF